MITLTAVALTCWVCSLIALPRKPLPHNEVQELVYARLLGRQHLLMLVALVVTAGAFLTLVTVARPGRIDPHFHALRHPNGACVQAAYNSASCATAEPSTQAVRELQDDGKWTVVSTFTVPHE